MTDTQTPTKTDTIADLEAAVREASAHERELALEVDALPSKIQAAAHEDARSKAVAARSGEAVAAVDQDSDVPALRQREADLPYERWAASIRTASLEVELNEAQQEKYEAEAEAALSKLPSAEEAANEAQAKADAIRSDYIGANGAAGRYSYYAAQAAKHLRLLEEEYPGV